MDYRQTLDYLYAMLPMFHRIGPAAFKKDLTNTLALCEALGHPEKKFKSIHIAGTNGKGSTSHMLGAILQSQGYKTGLYTSPHLVDFRERVRVNGEMVSEDFVVRFVEKNAKLIEKIEPSFFEVTVAMAFDYFAEQKVDFAVIETGLGGRLDSTNVISPVISIITNISYDHQNMLGDTLAEIAGEKAGIIKPNTPVIIGKRQAETEPVFINKAKQENSPIYFAEDFYSVTHSAYKNGRLEVVYLRKEDNTENHYRSPMPGHYQLENIATILKATDVLKTEGIALSDEAINEGIENVTELTGLRGRWEVLQEKPLIVCDVAHNEAGLKAVFSQVATIPHDKLRIVYGMVKDKDINKALSLLPKNALYYFCKPDIPRGLDVDQLLEYTAQQNLKGSGYASVAEAFQQAKHESEANDIVLVAGSIFVVAEVLAIN
jgi:dihydrofolate synthase/folylpolyglutamate synthase